MSVEEAFKKNWPMLGFCPNQGGESTQVFHTFLDKIVILSQPTGKTALLVFDENCVINDDGGDGVDDDDLNEALTGRACYQCKSPAGSTHDVGMSALSDV